MNIDNNKMELEESKNNLKKLINLRKNKCGKIKFDTCICGTKDLEIVIQALEDKDKKIQKILDLIFEYGQIDGDHHKTWVIDQIVRILQVDNYKKWVYDYEHDEETGDTYTWETGVAP